MTKNYQDWTTEEVAVWLEKTVKLPALKPKFQELGVDGSWFDLIEEGDLEGDFGISVRIQRKKILDAIQKIKKSQGQ